MVSVSLALQWLNDSRASGTFDCALTRLLDPDAVPVGNWRDEESPEDVLITLVNELPSGDDRSEIIDACIEAGTRCTLPTRRRKSPSNRDDVLLRVARVVAITEATELNQIAKQMLHFVSQENVAVGLRAAVARAVLVYPSSLDSIGLWRTLLTVPDFASYALIALSRSDMSDDDLSVEIVSTFERMATDNSRPFDPKEVLAEIQSAPHRQQLGGPLLCRAQRSKGLGELESLFGIHSQKPSSSGGIHSFIDYAQVERSAHQWQRSFNPYIMNTQSTVLDSTESMAEFAGMQQSFEYLEPLDPIESSRLKADLGKLFATYRISLKNTSAPIARKGTG